METIEQAYNKILTDENLMESITHGTNRYPFDFFISGFLFLDLCYNIFISGVYFYETSISYLFKYYQKKLHRL